MTPMEVVSGANTAANLVKTILAAAQALSRAHRELRTLPAAAQAFQERLQDTRERLYGLKHRVSSYGHMRSWQSS